MPDYAEREYVYDYEQDGEEYQNNLSNWQNPALIFQTKLKAHLARKSFPNPIQERLQQKSFPFLQTQLQIGQPNDPYEQEADRIAEQVVTHTHTQPLQKKCAVCEGEEKIQPKPLAAQITSLHASFTQKKCAECEAEEQLQGKFVQKQGDAGIASSQLESQIHATQGSGQPLDPQTQSEMESGFGTDFSKVNIHTDSQAVQMNEELGARAFTTGQDIYFNQGAYEPDTNEGKKLLAHELVHTVQQNAILFPKRIQRFHLPRTEGDTEGDYDDRDFIAPNMEAFVENLREIIEASTQNGFFNLNHFIRHCGGRVAEDYMAPLVGSPPSDGGTYMLNRRYVLTCGCGLLDMRHFIQLMYMSNFFSSMTLNTQAANRAATRRGREHELEAEIGSRFGAEDMPSNALGAFAGTLLPGIPDGNAFLHAIERVLNQCNPVDYASLPASEKERIAHFYGDTNLDGSLVNQNQTAIPHLLNISACSGLDSSFPFVLDDSDSNRSTISGFAPVGGLSGLNSSSEVRDFIRSQREEFIRGVDVSEKIRLIRILLTSWWIYDEDVSAIERICHFTEPEDLHRIHRRTEPLLEDMWSDAQRQRVHDAISGR